MQAREAVGQRYSLPSVWARTRPPHGRHLCKRASRRRAAVRHRSRSSASPSSCSCGTRCCAVSRCCLSLPCTDHANSSSCALLWWRAPRCRASVCTCQLPCARCKPAGAETKRAHHVCRRCYRSSDRCRRSSTTRVCSMCSCGSTSSDATSCNSSRWRFRCAHKPILHPGRAARGAGSGGSEREAPPTSSLPLASLSSLTLLRRCATRRPQLL